MDAGPKSNLYNCRISECTIYPERNFKTVWESLSKFRNKLFWIWVVGHLAVFCQASHWLWHSSWSPFYPRMVNKEDRISCTNFNSKIVNPRCTCYLFIWNLFSLMKLRTYFSFSWDHLTKFHGSLHCNSFSKFLPGEW